MKHAPDMQNPITDECAKGLSERTDTALVPFLVRHGTTWLTGTPEYRDWFRARARRFMMGDTSVLPPTPAIGARKA